MTKKKVKEERKKILEKYGGKPLSEFPLEELKDKKSGSWIWLMDSVDFH